MTGDKNAAAAGGAAQTAGGTARPAGDAVHEKHYSLTTALCMIVGICIGSGIYFKADNVLIATGGSVALGVAMFVIASVVIVFGGLALSVYAERGEKTGGVLGYADDHLPPALAHVFSWNYGLIYLPSIVAVLCWVVGVYFCMVFGLGSDFATQMLVGVCYLVLCAIWNVIWPKASGWFQNATTFIKVLPLLAVGAAGLAFGGAGAGADGAATAATASGSGAAGWAWLAAAAPIAFSFDGWTISATIAPELRNARRNLPLALVVGPLLILALYLAYFVGLSTVLGPEAVMEAGDASLGLFFVRLFGERAATLPNVVALISVMGTVNGVLLSCMRMPYALAQRGQIPCSEAVGRVSARVGFPVVSACVGVAATLAVTVLHVAATAWGLIPNGDVSEVSISFNMFLTAALLLPVLCYPVAQVGWLRGRVAPVLAALGCVFVGASGLLDPARWGFLALYAVVLLALSAWKARKDRGSDAAAA